MTQGTTKRMIIMLIIAGVIVGGIVAFQGFKNTMIAKAIKGQANPPQTVSTTVAQESTWQPTVEALGSFSASQQASLSAEVSGRVTAIHFDSGQTVRAGQPLVELNPEPLKAQLAQLEVQAGLAELNLKRDEAQLKVQAISQSVVDTDKATLKSAQAQVATQRALIAQKTISAPFSGQLGIRQVNLGQYLAPGAAVVTLQKLDPMEVDFTVPQSQIDLVRVGMKAQVETSAVPGRTFNATVTAVEPQIDTATRNLKVRARVPNPGNTLLPGVFATVRITQGAASSARHPAQRRRVLQPLWRHGVHRERRWQGAGRQTRADGAAALHHHRTDTRRSGCDSQGREGRRNRGDRWPAQAAQRFPRHGEQQRAAFGQSESASAQLLKTRR